MKSLKNGFTLVEIVITLAVISVVSLIATSIVLSSQKVQEKIRDEFLAINLCNNSVAIFQSAASSSASLVALQKTFNSDMNALLGYTATEKSGKESSTATEESGNEGGAATEKASEVPEAYEQIYLNGKWEQVNDPSAAKFDCEISFTFSNETAIFAIQVTENGKQLSSASYSMKLRGARQ